MLALRPVFLGISDVNRASLLPPATMLHAMSTATVHRPSVVRVPHARARTPTDRERVLLVPGLGGWSLVSTTGEVLVQRLGAGARRACLEYARAAGILAILS